MELEQEKYVKERHEGVSLCYCSRDVKIAPGKRHGPVVRDVYIIECCTSGRGTVSINGKEFALNAGKCVCLFPGDVIIHTADEKDPRTGVWCAIDGLNVGELFKNAGISAEQPYAPDGVFAEICENINRLVDTKEECDMGADYRRKSRVYAIIGALLKNKSTSNENIWVKRAVGYMETNYQNDINVAIIAKAIGLERSYFSTLFKERTGHTPSAYLTSLRIEKACSFMKNGEYSIAKIAEMTGFDPQNFARIFKRECGVSPRCYRDRVFEGEISPYPNGQPEKLVIGAAKPLDLDGEMSNEL